MMIDGHLHLWDLDAGGVDWLKPEMGALFDTFTPEQAHGELAVAGFDGAVLVQAEDSFAENRRLLAIAGAHHWVLGVVGWIPIEDPAAAETALDEFAVSSEFCGVRQLTHIDPRDDVLRGPEVGVSLGMLAERDLAFDVPDAWPRDLRHVADLADAHPGLRIVVDHLGKPPAATLTDEFAAWRRTMAEIAARENVYAKVSGLHTPAVEFGVQTVRPAWDVALECFGPARLLFGSDWPMTTGDGGYAHDWAVVGELIYELTPAESALVLGQTAHRVYRLDQIRKAPPTSN